MEDLKKKILSCMADVIKQNGFRTEFFKAENGQQPMTRVELSRLGKVKQDVIVDMWFPPAKMAREETALFQMHATMLQVDSDAVSRNLPELKRARCLSSTISARLASLACLSRMVWCICAITSW